MNLTQQETMDRFNKWWIKQQLPDIAKNWCFAAFVEGGLFGTEKTIQIMRDVQQQAKDQPFMNKTSETIKPETETENAKQT
jgi:hypothetical protein